MCPVPRPAATRGCWRTWPPTWPPWTSAWMGWRHCWAARPGRPLTATSWSRPCWPPPACGRIRHAAAWPPSCVAGSWAGTVEPGQLAPAFPRTGLDGLAALGLVEHDGGALRAAVDLRPYAFGGTELWVASDLGAHQRPGVLRRDHVLGIGQASLTLAQLTIRTDVERALDLGTGCGIQLFHLLGHCRHVTATDISARALAFTRFNLVLNAAALGLDPDASGGAGQPAAGQSVGAGGGGAFRPGGVQPAVRDHAAAAGGERRRAVHLPRRRPARGRHRGFPLPHAPVRAGRRRGCAAAGQLGDPRRRGQLASQARAMAGRRTPTPG